MKTCLLLLFSVATMFPQAHSADSKIATDAVNALGVDLYHAQAEGDGNFLLSPYSIQTALAMTYTGATGDTRDEMQRVLHYSTDEKALHESFSALMQNLAATAKKTAETAGKSSGPGTPVEFDLANRLFAQSGYGFRPSFLDFVKEHYGAGVELVNYQADPEGSRKKINQWVDEQTHDKIRDLIPSGIITPLTRLTLVNALYLRAPWRTPFEASATKNEKFLVQGHEPTEVPMMQNESTCGYARRDGFQIVTRAYQGGELQFVIVLPDKADGLAAIEKQLTPELIAGCASLPAQKVVLHLPKFRLEPPTLRLDKALQALGMKTAFDIPRGSANFDRMAPLKEHPLYIQAVVHKTFLALDEKGTEAAAATAVIMATRSAIMKEPAPVNVLVDHPFLFMIQYVPSGACVFIGRVTDPR